MFRNFSSTRFFNQLPYWTTSAELETNPKTKTNLQEIENKIEIEITKPQIKIETENFIRKTVGRRKCVSSIVNESLYGAVFFAIQFNE